MKNLMITQNLLARLIIFCFFLLFIFVTGCRLGDYDILTTDDVNMTGYFERHPETFSKFLKVLDLTGNSGYLGAYGAYTIFAPTNNAIDVYLREKGLGSVELVDIDELKDLVRFHLIEDTLSSSKFTDGKLPKITMYGQYIITGVSNIEGISKININRQAYIIEENIRVGNGIIHSIDNVLQPASKTIAQLVESKSEFSIFTEALRKTGYYDTLNINYSQSREKIWYTLLAQTDEVYHSDGIESYDDLKGKYSHTGDPTNVEDSLHLYIAYRIIRGNNYIADIVTAPSHPTLAPLEVVTSKLKGDNVLINEDIFNGVLEEGSPVNRGLSDFSATNGVLHSVLADFTIKVRNPTRVYFDLCDQPELRVMPQWRNPGAPSVIIGQDQLREVTIDGGDITYIPVPASEGNTRAFYDYFEVYLRPAVIRSIEFTTPTLVRGRYRVWICYRRTGTTVQAFFNDEPLPRTVDLAEFYPAGVSEGELLAQGWKHYTSDPTGHSQARLAGTIEVKTTGRHKIKLVGLVNTTNRSQLDMIQFIPADEDQLWPKISMNGSLIHRED